MKICKVAFLLLVIIITFSSQSLNSQTNSTIQRKVKYQPITESIPITYYYPEEKIPDSSVFIFQKKYQTDYKGIISLNKLLLFAKKNAIRKGANILHMVNLKYNDLGIYSNYTIVVRFYRNFEKKALMEMEKTRISRYESQIPKDSNYALVHFYRPRGIEFIFGFEVEDGDANFITDLKRIRTFSLKTSKYGEQIFVAEFPNNDVLMNIQPEEEYFVRCSFTSLGMQFMEIVDNNIGRKEFNSVR
jgi:hypothetical protein